MPEIAPIVIGEARIRPAHAPMPKSTP